MANNNFQNTSKTTSNSFVKGLNKDADPLLVQEGMWTHARNVVNNTSEGNLGTLSNAESNILCSKVGESMALPLNPLTGQKNIYIVGSLYMFSSYWIVFSVGYNGQDIKPIMSEIGLFDEDRCLYRPIVQDACLNFNKLNLVTGATKLKNDCSWQVYWADGLNPDRYMNIGDPKTWPPSDYVWLGGGALTMNYYGNGTGVNMLWPGVPWLQNCTASAPGSPNSPACVICRDDNSLVCDELRLARLVDTPCLTLGLSQQQGVIENGSYAVVCAYVINRVRVTDYFSNSYIQPIWNTPNERGSLEIQVDADSTHFDEFELVVVRFIDQNLSAKRIGYYSTRTTTIVIDQIPESKETVPVELLLLQNPVFEKSEQMTEVNNYLLRIGPTNKFDFNYQPLANLIRSEWVSVEYPETYYINGGNHTSYLRDEVYAFFIRWVYNTGDKSASYHIPGRAPQLYSINGQSVLDTDPYIDNNVSINSLPGDTLLFESVNTATVIPLVGPTQYTADGGKIIAKGQMGYWQSSEIYSDNQPDIWNSSAHCWTMSSDPNYDLCGQPIRHHKFPDNAIHPDAYHFNQVNGDYSIRLMGVQFNNIIYPKDNDGNDIPGIVGYEILRGSRHGNKTILAKGMVNNFRDYNIQGSAANQKVIGLYANYPFNCITPKLNQSLIANGPLSYNYQFNDPFIVKKDNNNNKENQNIPKDILSFHSPDTSFINPYLSTSEVKIYGSLQGKAEQKFIEPSKHPKFKLLSNKVLVFALLGGVINMILKGLGNIKINYPGGNFDPQFGLQWTYASAAGNSTTGLQTNSIDAGVVSAIPNNTIVPGSLPGYFAGGGPLAETLTNGTGLYSLFNTSNGLMQSAGGYYTLPNYDKTYTAYEMLPPAFQQVGSAVTTGGQLFFYFIEGMQETVATLYAIIKKRQYALEQIGHGDYNTFVPPNKNYDRRYVMETGQYIYDQSQNLPEFQDANGNLVKYRINNIKRPKLAVIRTTRGNGQNDGPHFITQGASQTSTSVDQSLMTLGYAIDTFNPGIFNTNIGWSEDKKQTNFINNIASHYVGLKYSIINQYGQLDTIQQVVVTGCEQKFTKSTLAYTDFGTVCGINNFKHYYVSTDLIFGGDTYINRFTEKTIMPFFYDWLYDVPDNIEWNYYINQMIPEPKFMVNSQPWDISDFNLTNLWTWISGNPNYGTGLLPRSYYDLDNAQYLRSTNKTILYAGLLGVKNAYFYTAACGIKDFFVESDVLVDFRDTGTFPWEQSYDKYSYTDLPSLFDSNPQILAKGNFYAYDYTLSASRFLFNQYFTAGILQGKNYNPNTAELCYTSYPNRINYSLQQQEDSLADGWITYLPLNKVDFKSKLNSVKTFAKTGMFITFKNDSPLIYQGVDTLQLEASGTKVTVGDAGLFNQAPQNVVVSEKSYEYGSAQNKYSVISTPAGLYYVSADQGKIFAFRTGLEEISQDGMKWWFSYFLPFKILEDFPDYPHTDNPVAGVGCNATYDNWNSILYFSKRDFKLRNEYIDPVTGNPLVSYIETHNTFVIDSDITKFEYPLGHPTIFQDASWTVSYDPKSKFWISFYDWIPNLIMPSTQTFFTTKGNGIWKQAGNCAEYCNFYGVQYPFEIEVPVITPVEIRTLKNIEYYLECYKRDNTSCVDEFHVLDYNFDKAVIFNSEQISGELNLNIFPKNNITLSLDYPSLSGIAPNQAYEILFSKEENKYRINQFWDITKDRGEFPINSDYPPTGPVIPGTTELLGNHSEQYMWLTEPNGYIKSLNQANLDYTKSVLQRKKFRHYINFLRLVKTNSKNVNMIYKIINTNNQYSPR
jgi:hypothetical protein